MLRYRTYIIGGDEKADPGAYLDLLIEASKGMPRDFFQQGVKFEAPKSGNLPPISSIESVRAVGDEERDAISALETRYHEKSGIRVPMEMGFGIKVYSGEDTRFENRGEPEHVVAIAQPRDLGRIIKAFSPGAQSDLFLDYLTQEWEAADKRARRAYLGKMERAARDIDINSAQGFHQSKLKIQTEAFEVPEFGKDPVPRMVTCEIDGTGQEVFSRENMIRTIFIAAKPERASAAVEKIRLARTQEEVHPPISSGRAQDHASRGTGVIGAGGGTNSVSSGRVVSSLDREDR